MSFGDSPFLEGVMRPCHCSITADLVLRRQRADQRILLFGPGPARLGRPGSPPPLRLAHLAARILGVVRAPACRCHGGDDVGRSGLAALCRCDLRPRGLWPTVLSDKTIG